MTSTSCPVAHTPRAVAAAAGSALKSCRPPAAATARPFAAEICSQHVLSQPALAGLSPRSRRTQLAASRQDSALCAHSECVDHDAVRNKNDEPWEATEDVLCTSSDSQRASSPSEEASASTRLGATLLLAAAATLTVAEPAAASTMTWATRDITVSKELFMGASLLWNASQLTGTMFLTSRFMMSWFPKVERRRAEEPWAFLARPVDLILDPTIRRLYGLRERTLVRVRVDDDRDASGGASSSAEKHTGAGGGPRRFRARDGTSDRVTLQALGGVDVAAPTALAVLMLLGETLGPAGALFGADLPQALMVAHESVSILQMGSLIISWWLVCGRFFNFV